MSLETNSPNTTVPSERIFHVSETAGLHRFQPRPDSRGRPLVWAIGESRLHNYLLPRDCPRITYYATVATTPADRAAFFSVTTAESVVAVEKRWLAALRMTPLHVYELPTPPFRLEDAIAGYYTCADAVTAIDHYAVPVPLDALLARPIELRLLSSLLPLREAVLQSSLGFSMIRMRNAYTAA